MANNGIFYSSGNTLNFTTNNTTWATLTSGGTFVMNTVSGGTYLNLPSATFTGGTVTGATNFTNGLTANTISATTYQNLPLDRATTGGTYNASAAQLRLFDNYNNAINIFGITQLTGGTYSNGTATFTNSTGGTFTVTGIASQFTGGTVTGGTNFTGGLTANTISATTYLNLPFSGTVRTSGTTTSNYIPRFTGTTTLTNSSIQDNGTNVGVNTTPSSSYKMSIYSLTNTPLYVQNQTSNGTSITVLSNGPNSQTGISAIGYGGTSANNTGVIGQAYDGLLAIGIKGNVGITEFGSITTGIGGYFDGIGDGGFGVPTNSYSVQLIDGTEGTNKVLISTTSDGKANWSNTLTGLTNVRSTTISATTYSNLPSFSGGSITGLTINGNLTVTGNTSAKGLTATTISATTYQNLPSSQTTYVFNMNSFAVPNNSLFYGLYLGGTPVSPVVVATQYGGGATDFFPGYPMPSGTASTLTVILRIAQVAPTSSMTLKLSNTSTSTFGPVITIAAGSAAGTYTDNSATVGFTTNQRLTIVASNPFVAGATSGPQLTTGSFKYQLS